MVVVEDEFLPPTDMPFAIVPTIPPTPVACAIEPRLTLPPEALPSEILIVSD